MNSKTVFLVVVIFAPIVTIHTDSLPAQQAAQEAGVQSVARNAAPTGARPTVVAPVNPMQPYWIPLTPPQQKFLDEVLAFWEFKSNQVKRYRCRFRRWEYDPVWGPKDPNKCKTFSEGSIKYSAPDKGLFRVEAMTQYQPPRNPGGAEYVPVDKGQFDHWICDGQWVYFFDHQRKRLVQSQLPPDMRGKAIAKGPLPFLFNAKADDIKRRFWIRVITPSDKIDTEYHLEAVPRTQEDAGNIRLIHIIIDKADYLPKAMVVFDRAKIPTRTTYEFNSREVNFSILAERLNLFHREFFEPAVPSGWAKDLRKWNQPVAMPAGGPATARGAGGSATSR